MALVDVGEQGERERYGGSVRGERLLEGDPAPVVLLRPVLDSQVHSLPVRPGAAAGRGWLQVKEAPAGSAARDRDPAADERASRSGRGGEGKTQVVSE